MLKSTKKSKTTKTTKSKSKSKSKSKKKAVAKVAKKPVLKKARKRRMAKKDTWSKKQLLDLYRYKHNEKKTIREISTLLKKTQGAVSKKYKRVDWEAFISDPDLYLSEGSNKKWTQVEMAQLYAFLQSDKSYGYIAENLGRSYISIERKAQTTNWQAWKAAIGENTENPENVPEDEKEIKERFITSLVILSRYDHKRLKNIGEMEFLRKINFDEEALPPYITFKTIMDGAKAELDSMGFGNPELTKYKEGTYVIVGDSHGKHTKTNMFKLITHINKHIKPTKIIHIGHILDDDNDISYNWGKIDNLVIVAKVEELQTIQDQRNKFDFNYEIIRGGIQLGNDLLVMNQDMISDYVKTPISNLDSQIFDSQVIVNSHRLELMPKCSNEGPSYLISPGALCEKHINRTIKQIDFEDKKTVKHAYCGSFSKYRRMQHMFNYWNQGMIVVNVARNGDHTPIPCMIKKMGKRYITAYFDKMVTSEGVRNPDKKIFVAGDTHSPNHDSNVLDILEQVCFDYEADVYVNVGDVHDYRCLNHHTMEKGITITENILDESAKVHSVLKRMATWAKESHLLYGNHERFAADFMAKFPQFDKYLDFRFLCGLDKLGYNLTNLKDVLKIGTAKFIHGDVSMYGQSGSKIEKISRTFGENSFVGHVHFPSIRFGSYSIGLSGTLDQDYNEPTASKWIHGFGMCNQYEGASWLTTIPIVDNKCYINDQRYTPKAPKSWDAKKYKVSLVYEM